MAKYGRGKFRKRRRFGGKSRKPYGKMRFKKGRSHKARVYRTGGNFAAGKAGLVEQKSFDSAVPGPNPNTSPSLVNWTPDAGSPWAVAVTASSSANNANLLMFTNVDGAMQPTAPAAQNGNAPVLLNGIIQGPDIAQRLGRQVMMTSMYIRGVLLPSGNLTIGAASNTWSNVVSTAGIQKARLLVVYDKQANAAPLAKSDLLAGLGTAGVVTAGTGVDASLGTPAMMNLGNRERFLVLCDKVYTLDAQHPVAHVNIYKKIRLPVIFNASPGTGGANLWATITSGSVWAVPVGDNPPASNGVGAPNPLVTVSPVMKWGTCRIRFKDP